ncbi:fluoride efflux transporter FluC [Allokutzneria albata]|uniref:Fluoride-specific ion channel FluC n=1 Tax=Allokutzneria albata TaxID=211114 RepID=A0A1G9Z9N1_ALLAB|nr:CrcB family protein [Allokutzneria albata]SDN17133.1 camphor resistance protein CrcB [Allokutzneria albata]
MNALLVALGAGIGAPLRYLAAQRFGTRGIFAVNVIGSFVLGVLTGAAVAAPGMALLGTGLCGALTTYSTFGYENVELLRRGAGRAALLNVAGSVVLGVLAAAGGFAAGAALFG